VLELSVCLLYIIDSSISLSGATEILNKRVPYNPQG
jgi:hypothetical protein